MEIALLQKDGLKIKGKSGVLAVDHIDNKGSYQAFVVLNKGTDQHPEDHIVIAGPGEYEVSGIKLTGLSSETGMIYIITIDGVKVALGMLSSLNKMQSKVQEPDVVIALCDATDASFLTSLAVHAVVLYGEQADAVAHTFGDEHIKTMTKYSTTKEKLPAEVETVLLAIGN